MMQGLLTKLLMVTVFAFCNVAAAQTQYCDADMLAPIIGFQGGNSWINVQGSQDDTSETYDVLIAIIEQRTIEINLARGWESFTLTLAPRATLATPHWDWSGVFQGGFRSGSGVGVIFINRPLCPSGYLRNFGSYNGQKNQSFCTLEVPDLQQCDTTPKPDKQRGNCDNLMEGNPCNVATGNKYQAELDFKGRGAFPLRYVRHYNSDAGTRVTELGPQWAVERQL